MSSHVLGTIWLGILEHEQKTGNGLPVGTRIPGLVLRGLLCPGLRTDCTALTVEECNFLFVIY